MPRAEIVDMTDEAELLIDSDADILEHLCNCGQPYGYNTILWPKDVYCSASCASKFG